MNDANANIHSLYMRDAVLCLECPACGHRSVKTPEDLCGREGKGDMTPLSEIASRARCQCGHKGAVGFPDADAVRVTAWVAAKPA